MGEYKVQVNPLVQADAMELAEHLNRLPPDEAIKHIELIINRLELLATTPQHSSPVKDMQLRLRGYRTLKAGTYTVFLVIKGDTVSLRRILFSRRQYDWLL